MGLFDTLVNQDGTTYQTYAYGRRMTTVRPGERVPGLPATYQVECMSTSGDTVLAQIVQGELATLPADPDLRFPLMDYDGNVTLPKDRADPDEAEPGAVYRVQGVQYIQEQVQADIDTDEWQRIYGQPFNTRTSITSVSDIHEYCEKAGAGEPDIKETGGAIDPDDIDDDQITVQQIIGRGPK